MDDPTLALMNGEDLWVGPVPGHCHICGVILHQSFWDAKLRGGPWAIICLHCHTAGDLGAGLGHGQRYEQAHNGKWVKVEG